MKLCDLKKKIAGAKESDLDNDVVIITKNTVHHVCFAKNANYNKRDGKCSPRIFEIVCEGG